ncbi:MAG TPA: hypothetical protein VF818_01825 [Ktedonobacterales bacterium]
MRIIVNHLTRMAPGFICVAGVNPETDEHVRPTTYGRLSRRLLGAEGGPFDIAVIVDLGETVPDGITPEVEDYYFEPSDAHIVGTATPNDYWTMLGRVARPTLADIFGPDLQRSGNTCSTARGKGLASLGCLNPATRSMLIRDNFGKLRMRLSDGAMNVSVSVTDIRLVEDDHTTIRDDVVADVNRRIARGVPVTLSVGLSRPFAKAPGEEERHWLQVNGIHLEDNPVWQSWHAPGRALIDLDDIPF